MSIRSSKDLKRELLKRAIREGRGPEMILLIQWTNARIKHESERDCGDLHKFEDDNFAQPRAVRMLNLLAALEGQGVRFTDSELSRQSETTGGSVH
jgi:hypothetical protein